MPSKRQEQIVIHQGKLRYQRDTPFIAGIIQHELDVQLDEVSEKQATGLINITSVSYEMGMFAGLRMGEKIGHKLSRIVIFN